MASAFAAASAESTERQSDTAKNAMRRDLSPDGSRRSSSLVRFAPDWRTSSRRVLNNGTSDGTGDPESGDSKWEGGLGGGSTSLPTRPGMVRSATRVLPAGFSGTKLGLSVSSNKISEAQMLQKHWGIIDPQRAQWTAYWDFVMLIALGFTALITPVEIAFLEEGLYITPLWVVNRLVDVCFFIDMVITFNMGYQERSERGHHWVYNRWAITKHYLKGWFMIDFFSVLPFFLITLNYDDLFGANRGGEATGGPQGVTRATVLFRVVKLLRMLKLTRVFKATRVIERHLLDIALHRWEWTFAQLKIVKLLVLLVMYSHAQACTWGLISSWLTEPTWISHFDTGFESRHGVSPQPLDRYAAAIYWSLMTLTGIGYGDIVPQNTPERVLCALYMLFSGMMWTYAIGKVAAIATTLNPNQIYYENTMDQLNYFMRERELPRAMRMTLREFFEASRRVNQLNDDGELLNKMSPLLQGSVALAANSQWVHQIWFLRDIGFSLKGVEFIAALAKRLVLRNYVANERLPIGQLYVLRRGLCVKMWRFLNAKKVWGEDIILDNIELVDHAQAVALTYVEAFTLRRNALDSLLGEFDLPRRVVRRAARRIALQRALLKYLTQLAGKRGPASFIMRSMAHGVDEVDDKLTSDRKMDLTLDKLNSLLKDSTRGSPRPPLEGLADDKRSSHYNTEDDLVTSQFAGSVSPGPGDGALDEHALMLAAKSGARIEAVEAAVGSLSARMDTVKSDVAEIKRLLKDQFQR